MIAALVFIAFLWVAVTAGIIEWIKQKIPEQKFDKRFIWLLAGVFSALAGFVLWKIEDFGLGLWIVPLYAAGVYILQYIVDFALVKKIVVKFLENLGKKTD